MRIKIFLFAMISILLFGAGCNEKEEFVLKNRHREKYLVEKITKYESSATHRAIDRTAEFFYDGNNKLTKRVTTGKLIENGQVRPLNYVDEFEYNTKGLVSKIRVHDLTHSMSYHDIKLSYDSKGNLIKQEMWRDDYRLYSRKFHYDNGRMVSIYDDKSEPFEINTIVYDKLGNAVKSIHVVPKQTDFGEPIEGEFEEVEYRYEYDGGIRPNFGIDYLFVYELLIGMGTTTGFARGLSQNNLTKYLNDGGTWTFTYDEKGLPISYEVKWGSGATLYPMIYEITYKQVE